MEAVTDFLFLDSKITADGDCSHEIRRQFASWQKSYDKPTQYIKKQRHHFADKGPHSQGYGLSISHIQLWELDHKEGRVPKNWCLQTAVFEKTLESLLDARSNQSVLKEINPEYSLEGLMLKLKLQYLVTWRDQPTNWKRPWCWQRLKAQGNKGDRSWDGWMGSLMQWTWTWAKCRMWWGTGKPGALQFMG